VPLPLALGLSVLVLSGGSQFLAVSVVAAGGGLLPAVVGGLLLGARHLPYGLAMAPVVGRSWPARLLGAHLLIDEVVAFSRARGTGERAGRRTGRAGSRSWRSGRSAPSSDTSPAPPSRTPPPFGVDAAFPAALAALLLPALRGRGRQGGAVPAGRRGRGRRRAGGDPVPPGRPAGARRAARGGGGRTAAGP
jgi:predicted branched-subunit amino acid permease